MDKKLDLNKETFDKNKYVKTIDVEFEELGVNSISQDIQNTPTIEDFFALYDELFYEIPEQGENQSHEFLVKKSSEYINFDQENEEIQALREEITQLRKDLLDSKIENTKLKTNSNIEDQEIQNLKSKISEENPKEILDNLKGTLNNE